MFPIQVLARSVRDEELTRVCVAAFVRHAQYPTLVVRERGFDPLVLEGFLPPARFPAAACACRVSALEHEVADVSVEENVGVVISFGESYEVPDCLWRVLREELQSQGTVGCGYGCVAGERDLSAG